MRNRYTFTSWVWPILWTLPIAWSSWEGFHHGSQIATLLANARFRPVAPARIETIRKFMFGFSLNLFIAFCRFYTVIPPVIVSNSTYFIVSFSDKIVIILIHCVKTTHFYYLLRIWSNTSKIAVTFELYFKSPRSSIPIKSDFLI